MKLKSLFTIKVSEKLTTDPYKADVILLIDTSFMAYKAAYALMNLETTEGRKSGHVFGSMKQILGMLKDYGKDKTACLVFAFDGKPVHRLEIHPEYKAGRVNKLGYKPAADVEVLCTKIKGLSIHNPDFEADDAIAAFVESYKGNAPILLYSKDRDLWQLVPKVKVIYGKGELIGEKEVHEKFNVRPSQIPIHKAVFGDPSDNIHRIPRIRSSYLLPLVQASTTPEEFYRNVENREKYKIPDKARKTIISYREQVEKNFILAQLRDDCGFTTTEGGNRKELTEMLEEFECNSLVSAVKRIT